jgi:hypothetical protein
MRVQRLNFEKKLNIALALILLSTIVSGCDEFKVLQKVNSGEYELVKKDEIEQLRKAAEAGRSVGRYQLYSRGARTWRVDTATGKSCLLLTNESDWKKPETAKEGCPPDLPPGWSPVK